MKKNLLFAAFLASATMATGNEWSLDLVSTLPSAPVTVDGLTYSDWTAVYKDSPTADAQNLSFKNTSADNWPTFSKDELLSDVILSANPAQRTIIFTFSITNASSELVTLNSFSVTAFAANNSGQKQGGSRSETLVLTFGDCATQSLTVALGVEEKKEVVFTFSQPVELDAGQKVAVNLQLSKESTSSQFYPGLSAVSVKGTPEPATATLSLLALAGLASRRRRH